MNANQKIVFEALSNPEYTFRSEKALAKALKCDSRYVQGIAFSIGAVKFNGSYVLPHRLSGKHVKGELCGC